MLRVTSARFNHYLLTYKYFEGKAQERAPFRDLHQQKLQKWEDEGHLLIGAALQKPIDAGFYLFEVPNEEMVHEFVLSDPYYRNKLLAAYEVRQIHVDVGKLKAALID